MGSTDIIKNFFLMKGKAPFCSDSKKGVVVFGMHRSGTSCLAGLLEASGYWVNTKRRHHPHNEKGMFEDNVVRCVNRDILNQFNMTWSNPCHEIVASEVDEAPVIHAAQVYNKTNRWVLKDPRMVLTADVWLPHLPDHHVVGTFRNPVAVAKSLYKRNQMPFDKAINAWTLYNRKLVSRHKNNVFPIIHYGVDAKSYMNQFLRLCEHFKLPFENEKFSKFYDVNLLHHDVADLSGIEGEAIELYSYLCKNSKHD